MFDPIFKKVEKSRIIIAIFIAIFLNLLLLPETLFSVNKTSQSVYFLDVGQGDSQLIDIREERGTNVQILIDGGFANGKVLSELVKVLSPFDRYIDIVILTHSDADHFGGLIDVLQSYEVGVFVHSGHENDTLIFESFKNQLRETGVEVIDLKRGDSISYKDVDLEIIFPENINEEENINELSLVTKLSMMGSTFLLTGDIGEKTEKLFQGDLRADILKVAHHGSKFSSSKEFLEKVSPKISVIQVGKNSYGHPTDEVLMRLASVGSQVFRNDIDGTIKIELKDNKINIYKDENFK